MLKKIIIALISIFAAIVLVITVFYDEEVVRLNKVITMFDEDKISKNFRSFPKYIPTSKVEKSLKVEPLVSGASISLPETFSWKDSIIDTDSFFDYTNTDGFLIFQNDSIRYEYYGNGFKKDDVHISWSMSKSVISALFGIALSEGDIKSLDQKVEEYLPDFVGTGYDGVTLKNLLQMSSGVRFNEDYGDFNSDINVMGRYFALGMPMREFAKRLIRENTPGTVNHYVSIDTQVLGMILVEATGKSISAYMKEKLWDSIKAENDAYWITDNSGMEFALGGLNITLRDYARLGILYLDSGRWNQNQVVPENWVLESIQPLDDHVQPGLTSSGREKDGYGYQWWIPYGREDEFFAQGIYDQFIYIDPDKDMVIVKLSSNWRFKNDDERKFKAMSMSLFKEIANRFQTN